MRSFVPREIGLQAALVATVIGGIVLAATVLHLVWWRTATSVSRDLVDVLETQIIDAVHREWWGVVADIERVSAGLRDLLDRPSVTMATEDILVATSRAAERVSWLVLVPQAGDALAIQSLPDRTRRLFRADEYGRLLAARALDEPGPGLAAPVGPLRIRGTDWLARAGVSATPLWVDVAATPDGAGQAVAFAGMTAQGLLAAMIDYERFGQLLGSIAVGRTGRSFVVGPEGSVVIASQAKLSPGAPDLEPVARAAGARVAARPETGKNIAERVRLEVGGAGYAVGLSPLWFKGWQLAVIVPEAEFLAEIDTTIRRLVVGLAAFLLLVGVLVAVSAKRLLADPVTRVAGDLGLVERFELERIPHRRSRVREIDRLSGAIVRMAAGLADFAKFIPTDLVRGLVASGVRAEPGGERREITVLFADLAGFTGLAEQMGDRIVPVVGGFLELASHAIEAEGGTVDKFIGDAVMAFWGAPGADPDQALHACRAAARIETAMRDAAAQGSPLAGLRVRVGLHSGAAIVGNVGSARRLNYTALGDTVNLASRLEGANKTYGTTILLSAATRARAGGAIQVREVDMVAVYGRREGVRIFELTDLAGGRTAADIAGYARALALYREARFAEAAAALDGATADGPSRWLAARCLTLAATPPAAGWTAVTHLDAK
jgi:adenylate cyclase